MMASQPPFASTSLRGAVEVDTKRLHQLDPAKRLMIRIADKYLRKHLGDINVLEQDLAQAEDPVTRRLFEATQICVDQVEHEWQVRTFRTMRALLLGVFYRDTAYHDQGVAALRYLLLHADELLAHLPEIPPDEWYVNAAHRSVNGPHDKDEVFKDSWFKQQMLLANARNVSPMASYSDEEE